MALKLSPFLASSVEVARLIRELQDIDNYLLQTNLRSGKPAAAVKLPATSYLMDETVRLNKLDLARKADRAALGQALKQLHDRSPIMHISFGSTPSPDFVGKLMVWLRREIHPEVLVSIGLQPGLGAGCVLRTSNKYFDLSLRQKLIKHRDLLKAGLMGRSAA